MRIEKYEITIEGARKFKRFYPPYTYFIRWYRGNTMKATLRISPKYIKYFKVNRNML